MNVAESSEHYPELGRYQSAPSLVASPRSSNPFASMNSPSVLGAHSFLPTQSVQLGSSQRKLAFLGGTRNWLVMVSTCQVPANASLPVLVAPLQIYQMVWCSTQANLSLLVFLAVHLQISQVTAHHWPRACAFLHLFLAAAMRAYCVARFWGQIEVFLLMT